MARKVAFHTFGCKVNQYETEELRVQMRLGGYEIVPMEAGADVYVVNSCSVTADADSSCRQLVRKVLREKPSSRVVVTGCYAERAPDELREMSPRVEVFGNHEKALIAVALGVPTACVEEAARSGVTALADRTRAYIKIQDGCDAKCTYCIIPSVRPKLICRPPELILKEAQNLIARGFKEIVLTGVRLGRYVSFARIVNALVDLPGDFRVRLSSIEVTEIPDEIIELAAKHPKLCPFFHIPLQSGDDEVLKRMGRWYTAGQYRKRIRQIQRLIPDAALSADVIVGFTGEGEKHFRNTVELLQNEGFSRVHAFRYSIRPGTPAERLPNHVDPRIKSERTREMVKVDTELRRRYAQRFLGKPVRVLLESDGSGYTDHYVRVQVNSSIPEGQILTATPLYMTSEAVLVA
jgi:threonylcarbamoyladenosine tRNA methylthiotransferase MtaB